MNTTTNRRLVPAWTQRAVTFVCFAVPGMISSARAADEWLPITPEELQMKSEPKAPAAAAIYLYRQVDRDDGTPDELVYERIKVLTEEGRKYGNIEIPYIKDRESIRGVQARTIRPDGTIVDFDGTVYDRQIVKAQDQKLQARTFTLPNVEVGSIIEYRYRHLLRPGYVFDSRWVLSDDLFTLHAKFSLKPYEYYTLRWSWPLGLPDGTNEPKKDGRAIRLETFNVPAFTAEEYMPPPDVMKYRVEFIYEDQDSAQKDFAKYWKAFGKRKYSKVQSFVSDHRALAKSVAQTVQPGDSPEVKLRKLYAYVQSLRNLAYERARSEQEAQREKLADISDAEDALKRGYGSGIDLTWLFLGLAREAGFEADAVLLPTRDLSFFNPKLMNSNLLNSNAVVVKLDGRELYLDPGVPHTPFGMLPWFETAVNGMRLDKDGGTWVTTPLGTPAESLVERKAVLKLTTAGTLEGKVTTTYTGREAAARRLLERGEDDTDRRQFLEDELKRNVALGTRVKLTNSPDWDGSDAPLVAEYEFAVPGYAALAGRRALMAIGLFGEGEKHAFEHAARVQPLYFHYPYQHTDEISIELPLGWEMGSVPKPRTEDLKATLYKSTAEESHGSLRLKRELTMNLLLIEAKEYSKVRGFYQTIRAGDEDQVVVVPGMAPRLAH